MPSDVRHLNWFSDELTKISVVLWVWEKFFDLNCVSVGKILWKKNLIVNFISLMSFYKLENNVVFEFYSWLL